MFAFWQTIKNFKAYSNKSQQKNGQNPLFLVILPVCGGLLPMGQVAQNSPERHG
jgi:hypothetical protein